MAVYDQPGKGRKQCPCGVYVAARSDECEQCGHRFTAKAAKVEKKPEPEPVKVEKKPEPESGAKTWTEGGRGRKQCPACKVFFAALSKECPKCGVVYVKPPEPVPTPVRIHVGSAILAPAGKCPVELTGTDPITVRVWRDKLKNHFADLGKELADEGVRYFVRQFYDMHKNKTEYQRAIAAVG